MIRLTSVGELPITYFELFSLQNIAISTTRLPRSTRDGGIKTTSGELTFQESVDLGICCDVKIEGQLYKQKGQTLLPFV